MQYLVNYSLFENFALVRGMVRRIDLYRRTYSWILRSEGDFRKWFRTRFRKRSAVMLIEYYSLQKGAKFAIETFFVWTIASFGDNHAEELKWITLYMLERILKSGMETASGGEYITMDHHGRSNPKLWPWEPSNRISHLRCHYTF